MSLLHFVRLFNRNLPLFLLCAAVTGAVVFFLTRNLPKTYTSEMEIYTGIASGMDVENLGNTKVDYQSANTEYDNLINIIKSRQTLQEVGNRLLAQHLMLDSVDRDILLPESYKRLRSWVPLPLEKKLVVPYSVELTLRNIRQYKTEQFKEPRVKKIFENPSSPYSHKAIASIGVDRVQNSDLLRIRYSFSDPGIAQNTLLILNEVFTANVARIKVGQSNDVVNYFRNQVKKASERLDNAEERLQEFRVANRMINYQEQTRSLAIKKENMEDELMKTVADLEATQAAVRRLEKQLSLNTGLIKLGNAILEKKKELVDLRSKIAELETYYNDADLLNKLRRRANILQAEISNQVRERYEKTRTTDGIPMESVINEWLNYTLKLERVKAQLKVYKQRQQYFREKYAQFAKLGAKAARLEREITMARDNYMELVSSLNTAMLRQRSQRIASGGLVVTVPPNYPLTAEKSKAMLLTLVGGVIGFIIPFMLVVLREFLDSSIRLPQRAESLLRLKLLGAYPDLTRRRSSQKIDFEWLHDKAVGLLAQNMRMMASTQGISDKKPKYVLLFSTREGDGKQFNAHVLANELAGLSYQVMLLSPKPLPQNDIPYYEYVQYENNKRFINAEQLTEIMPVGFQPSQYDYVLLVIDAILTNPYPIDLLRQIDLGINITGAYRSWNRADKQALNAIRRALPHEPRFILNGVEPDFMQNVLGDIAKQRSFIRRFIKRILSMELRQVRLRERRS